MAEASINKRYCTRKLTIKYAHVGLLDVGDQQLWIAKKRMGTNPIQMSHARLITGGTNKTSTADKDRFVCTWFHTPNTGQGYILGYPIEWNEGHLLVRLDPNWNYQTQQFISNTQTRKIDRNIDNQFAWAKRIFQQYVALKPDFPLSWHMIGPRAADSMFYVERVEPPESPEPPA